MERISAVVGFLTLAMVAGHGPDHRINRFPTWPRGGATRGVHVERAGLDRRVGVRSATNATLSATSALVPVAIDSETGEPCCVSARQAGLLRGGRGTRRG